jgi:aerotaxis receptor
MVLRPLQRVLAFCNGMAAGRLGRSLDAQGQPLLHDVAVALNQLDVNLRAVVGDVRSESDGLRHATAEMAASNADLSARTDAQAASLQQTAVSMQQMMDSVQKSTESARRAAGLAQQANEVTRSGGQAVEALFETMSQVQAASRRIGEIISLIEGIALQSHILSLNAAVEATRGGGQGKGFAAVAAEVRTLAGCTTAAAKEVKVLVGELGSTVEAGTTRAGVARTTMDSALQAVVQVAELLQAISGSAQEQLAGVSQVNQAVGQLDSITHHNAAMVQQVAHSALQLREQAQAMADTVKVFHLGAAGDGVVASADAVALRRAAKATAQVAGPAPRGRLAEAKAS